MALALDQFETRIAESGLLSAEDLRSFLESLSGKERPPDSQQLARLLVKHKKLTAFQAQEIYKGAGASLVLGNYVILDKLGQGGMGMVLKAEHKRMKRLVAVKVLSPAHVKSEEAVRRFHREVEAAARLEHPNIVAAHDADEANGTHFLVMQFVDGHDLATLVRKNGPLPVDQALDCILQAARGLEYAHGEGVIHRDIKPANLLLDGKGTVKVLDMGLARFEASAAGGAADLTGTGQIMGTVDYMAPEQALNTKHADQRADIYSLGISLWYLITGRAAYEGETLMEKIMAHQSGPIPSLCEASGAVSPELDAVFRRMVAKQPAERYQYMREVLADLERCRTAGDGSSHSVTLRPSEDSRLSDFLRGAGAGSAAAARPAPAVAQDVLTLAPEATFSIHTQSEVTNPAVNVSVAADARRATKGQMRSAILVGALTAVGVFLVLLPLGIWWLSQRGNGTAQIQVPDNGSVVQVGGTDQELPPGPAVAPAGEFALAFDGVDDYVELLSLSGGGIPRIGTIETIATPARSGGDGAVAQICGAGAWLSIVTRDDGWGAVFQGSNRSVARYGSQVLSAGRTDHVAVVAEANSLRLYVNGQLSGSIYPLEGKRTGSPISTFGAATRNSGRRFHFAGRIHGVRVSKSARYAGAFTAPARLTKDADTIALYQFDEGQGAELKDTAGNALHGKIVGAKWVRPDGSPIATPLPDAAASAAPSANVVYLDDLPGEPSKGLRLGGHGIGGDGRPMQWLGKKPAHTLFTHPGNNSSATVTYSLDGKYDDFLATIGVLAKPITKLTFRVWGDDKKLWESTPISTPQLGTDVRVDVRGVQVLKLEVHCPGSYAYAQAVWIDPRLTADTARAASPDPER